MQGDEAAILAMGDLYYYGARGLARDQVLALQYYSQAHDLGNTVGSCGAAAMYLKGEGTKDNAKNVTMAIQLFESAAASGSVHALNGLGYIYFFGQELEKNEVRGFMRILNCNYLFTCLLLIDQSFLLLYGGC